MIWSRPGETRSTGDHREGTCGVSSAFVPGSLRGTAGKGGIGLGHSANRRRPDLYTNQGHQWAEVAFDGLGWISFEPTAPGGPVDRVASYSDSGSPATDSGDAGSQASTSLAINRNLGYWVPGTTTAQGPGLPHNPIFEVRGAEHTAYLRTATGDVYENGQWRQLDPVDLRYTPPADLPSLVASAIDTPGGPFSSLAPPRIDLALLAQFTTAPAEQHTDVIHITPLGSLKAIPAGPAPTSLHLQSASLPGTFRPYSSTLSIESPVPGYSWTSRVAVYSQQQLARATVSPDPTYTQLPDDLPDRIRNLALTSHGNMPRPYAKARAIETYLKSQYPYRFADSQDDLVPPGRDPVDWFLFDHREGTCGVFSSAFVVLARSVGLPARVVSGWAIAQTAGAQTVYTDQATSGRRSPSTDSGGSASNRLRPAGLSTE